MQNFFNLVWFYNLSYSSSKKIVRKQEETKQNRLKIKDNYKMDFFFLTKRVLVVSKHSNYEGDNNSRKYKYPFVFLVSIWRGLHYPCNHTKVDWTLNLFSPKYRRYFFPNLEDKCYLGCKLEYKYKIRWYSSHIDWFCRTQIM